MAARGSPLVVDRRVHSVIVQATMAAMAMRQEREALGSPWKEYLHDPVGFVTNVLGEIIWSKQREILEAVRDHRRVAVHSAHETSKSHTAARAVAWWISTSNFGDAFALTTAPTAPQVRAILWREIGRAYRRSEMPGRLNQTEWWLTSMFDRYSSPRGVQEELVAFGRKPSEYDETAFQGIHARRVLVIIDEACGVPENLWHAVGSLTGNDNSRILAIGNPDDSASYFAEICKPGSGWHVIHVDGLESPNFTDEAEELGTDILEQLLGRTYVQELIDDVGEDSPIYQSKVRGKFTTDDPSGVIPLTFIKACQYEDEERPLISADDIVDLGVDVGAGGDETNIRERRGIRAGRVWRYRTPSWSDAVVKVVDAIKETGARRAKIDVIGIGWGVVGRLKELHGQGDIDCQIYGVNVGQAATATVKPGPRSPTNPLRFPKLRDQIWWEIGRGLSHSKLWDLTEVDDKTIGQLIAPRYQINSSGQIKIESKEDTKKRLGRSPDDADSLLLAFYEPVQIAADVGSDTIEEEQRRERIRNSGGEPVDSDLDAWGRPRARMFR